MKRHLALNLGIAAFYAVALILGSIGGAMVFFGALEYYGGSLVQWWLK